MTEGKQRQSEGGDRISVDSVSKSESMLHGCAFYMQKMTTMFKAKKVRLPTFGVQPM